MSLNGLFRNRWICKLLFAHIVLAAAILGLPSDTAAALTPCQQCHKNCTDEFIGCSRFCSLYYGPTDYWCQESCDYNFDSCGVFCDTQVC